IDHDQALYCWGDNHFGQLGNGESGGEQPSPVRIGSDHDWQQVAAGGYHACALTTAGQAYCWGRNGSGQLGIGTKGNDSNSSVPVAVAFDGAWQQISAADYHSCGIDSDARLLCWGPNDVGQLGTGGARASAEPVGIRDRSAAADEQT